MCVCLEGVCLLYRVQMTCCVPWLNPCIMWSMNRGYSSQLISSIFWCASFSTYVRYGKRLVFVLSDLVCLWTQAAQLWTTLHDKKKQSEIFFFAKIPPIH
jgi:hypothetical protein